MCRSIKTLRGQDHTHDDIEAAALQFVRKVSGFRKPSAKNEEAFNAAVREIADITHRMLDGIETKTVLSH